MFDASEKRKVILGVTGSIAAYKSAELARLLVSWGYEVKVVMTEAATEFITPLTMQAVTGQPVTTSFWEESEAEGISHIQLADWADSVVIAPATADFIAKAAAGFCDNALLAIILATKSSILMAPAMNVNMFDHPKTKENLKILSGRGIHIVEPEEGALACGWNGAGRLADPWEIFYHVRRTLSPGDYIGKKVLITTGPTRENIDPVRFLSNRSSGKMGIALAREAFRRGADVTLIHGPVKVRVPSPVRCTPVVTAVEMREAILSRANGDGSNEARPDVIIMAAAVSDYRPSEVSEQKIKKSNKLAPVSLTKNPDILSELGEKRGDSKRPVLVGFAVETGELEDLLKEARNKLKEKRADLIVGNFASDAFDLDTNRVWLVDRNGRQEEVATSYKSRVANKILDSVLKL